MRALFSPAVALLNRLRYTAKFLLISAIAAIAAAVMMTQIYLQASAQMALVKSEEAGLVVLETMTSALTLMQQHRGMTAGLLGGDSALAPRVAEKAAALDAALTRVGAALADEGAGLGMESSWAPIAQRWPSLKAGRPQERGENFVAHTAMIEDTVSVIIDLGTASGLAFDPDAASSNLLSMLIREAPEMSERLGRLRGFGTGVLAIGMLSSKDSTALQRQLAQLEVTHEKIVDRLGRAARYNPSDAEALNRAAGDISAGFESVRNAVQSNLIDARFDLAPSEFFAVGTQAIDALLQHAHATVRPVAASRLAARHADLNRKIVLNSVVSALSILLVGYLLIGMYYSIAGSVRELTAGARRLAGGDYSTRVQMSTRDELSEVADQFNAMSTSLRTIIARVKSSSEVLGKAAAHMATASVDVAQGSERQSESASGMAAAVEQMTVGVEEIARHAKSASDKSESSGALAAEGGEVVRKSVVEMERITETVNQAAGVIRELGTQSERISTMVASIREIAEQTNLLALNAAIEAARAGETGRGFAVVADEVRKLAERTAKATNEITEMVGAIQGGTERAVSTMEQGVERVREGVVLTARAGQSMEQINEGAKSVLESVSDISHALSEQSAASNDIARNVEAIAQMCERNNAAVKQTADTAGKLENLATALRDEVAHFKV